jgi:hypothetical protein
MAKTYIRSTGVLRLRTTPGGELSKVKGGIQVPIGPESAWIAHKRPLGQAKLGFHVATGRAGLAGWKPWVSDKQLASIPRRFIAKQSAKFSHGSVRDCSGKVSVTEHSSDIELLNNYHVILLCQTGGQFVHLILAKAPYACMQVRNAASRRVSTTGTRPSPG